MSAHPLGHALRQLRRLADEQAGHDLSDAALLQRFRAGREETAFALLVQRHGPMVLGVCRRVLGDRHEAEDAFQATFLVLVRRAGAIHRREALGGWLHRVAYRVAARARDGLAPRSEWVAPAEKKIVLPPLKAPLQTVRAATQPGRPAAPELACQAWINSPPLRLADLRGKVVLLDFWATWCGPCVASLPELQQAHDLFADEGLVVISLHHNSVPAKDVEAFVKKRGLTFPVGVDDAEGQTCGRYNVSGYPTQVLVGRDGKVLESDLFGKDLLGAVRRAVLYGGADD